MIKKIEEITEYHTNGTLCWREKRAIIEPLFIDAYANLTTFRNVNNTAFIRLECTKFFDNGQLAWSLIWDEEGNLLNKLDPIYRKDGTIINKKKLKYFD